MIPGPPFVFGSLLVMCALLVSVFIPENAPISTDQRHRQIGNLITFLFTIMIYYMLYITHCIFLYYIIYNIF